MSIVNRKNVTTDNLVQSFCDFLPTIKEDDEDENVSECMNNFLLFSGTDVKKTKRKKKCNNKNLTIFDIDNKIKENFENEKLKVEEMEKKKKRYEWIKNNAATFSDKKRAKEELFKITKEIKLAQSGNKIQEYTERTKNIIDEVKDILSSKKVYSFVGTNDDEVKNNKRKDELLFLYFSIASKFIYVDPSFLPDKKEKTVECSECGCTYFDLSQDGLRVCMSCSTTIEKIESDISYKDTERINLIPRYNYSKSGHFKKAMDNYEGLQNKNIPQEIYDVIYKEIDKYENYSVETISKTAIYGILNKYGYGDYYEDINLIHCEITGIPPPCISQYRHALLKFNEEFEETYDKIKSRFEKDNALNVNNKLKRFLQHFGCHVNDEDLIGLKTSTKKKEHDSDIVDTFESMGIKPRWCN